MIHCTLLKKTLRMFLTMVSAALALLLTPVFLVALLLVNFVNIVFEAWDMFISLITGRLLLTARLPSESDDILPSPHSFWSNSFTVYQLRRICLTYLGISMNSSILSQSEQVDLYSLLFKEFGTDNNQYHSLQMIYTNLLYAATKESFCLREFNKLSVGHRDTLILLKNSYGNVIGGYASVGIPKRSIFKLSERLYDPKSFLFRIRSNKKGLSPSIFKLTRKHRWRKGCISASFLHLFEFGNFDLLIRRNRFSSNIGVGYVYSCLPKYDIDAYLFTGGHLENDCYNSRFEIEEIEVHQLKI